MKQSILRTFLQRLIGASATFVDAWEADPASVGLMQRLFAFGYKWFFTCSSVVSTFFSAFHNPVKRAAYMPESISVEQIDLFSYIEEMESCLQVAEISRAVPAPAASLPAMLRLSQLKRSLYRLWVLIHNLFGIAQWINVYTCTRAYGGREAGGWYYLKYTCEKSRQVAFWEAAALRLYWQSQYTLSHKWGSLYSQAGGQDVIVLIETTMAASTTKEAPTFGEYDTPIHANLIVRTGVIQGR